MSFILKAKKKASGKPQTRHLLPEMIRRLKAKKLQEAQLKALTNNVTGIQKSRVNEVYLAPYIESSIILKNAGNC
jgi:hypothetical protein